MVKHASLALALALLLPAAVSAAPRPPSVLASEPLLSKPVSYELRRIHLGELLDRIGATTGTHLAADDRLEPISGFELTLLVRKRSARELLEALPRLYSFPPDRWYWAREKGGRYVLHQTQPRASLLATRQQFAKEYLVQAWRRRAEFFAHPEKQKALAAADPALGSLAASDPADFARERQFFSFLDGLQEPDVRQILNGRRLDIPMYRLSPAQRQFIREEYRRTNNLGNPDVVQPEQLEKVTLRFSTSLTETLCVDLGPALGGLGLVGGYWLKRAQDDRRVRSWQAAGEDRTVVQVEIPAKGEVVSPQQLQLSGSMTDEALLRLGKLGRFDLLFDRAAGEVSADFGLGGPLPEVLSNLGRTNFDWKHWEPFYLFRHRAWDTDPTEKYVPWPLIRDLRQMAAENHGYLKPEAWSRLAALNKEQLYYLERTGFPDARSVSRAQKQLQVYAALNDQERLAAARPEGAGWEDFTPQTRQRLAELSTSQAVRAIRLLVRWPAGKDQPAQFFLGAGQLRPPEFPFQRCRQWDDPQGKFVELPEERPTP